MPLVGGTRSSRQRVDVRVGEQGAGVVVVIGNGKADVGDGHLAAGCWSRSEKQSRLERGEGDGALGRPDRAAQDLAGESVDPAGNVHGQHRCLGPGPLRRGVGPRQAGAEGRVDVQVGGGQHRGRVGHRHDDRPHPGASEPASRRPPVGAVVARPGQHDHPAPVAAAHGLRGGPGNGHTSPLDQDVDGLGRGRVDGRHPRRRDDRDHRTGRLGPAARNARGAAPACPRTTLIGPGPRPWPGRFDQCGTW